MRINKIVVIPPNMTPTVKVKLFRIIFVSIILFASLFSFKCYCVNTANLCLTNDWVSHIYEHLISFLKLKEQQRLSTDRKLHQIISFEDHVTNARCTVFPLANLNQKLDS